MSFGSWTHDKTKVDIVLPEKHSPKHIYDGKEWEVVHVKVNRQVKYSFDFIWNNYFIYNMIQVTQFFIPLPLSDQSHSLSLSWGFPLV